MYSYFSKLLSSQYHNKYELWTPPNAMTCNPLCIKVTDYSLRYNSTNNKTSNDTVKELSPVNNTICVCNTNNAIDKNITYVYACKESQEYRDREDRGKLN